MAKKVEDEEQQKHHQSNSTLSAPCSSGSSKYFESISSKKISRKTQQKL
jgi:hypothetical protein